MTHFQQQAAEDSFEESRAADQMLVAALEQEGRNRVEVAKQPALAPAGN